MGSGQFRPARRRGPQERLHGAADGLAEPAVHCARRGCRQEPVGVEHELLELGQAQAVRDAGRSEHPVNHAVDKDAGAGRDLQERKPGAAEHRAERAGHGALQVVRGGAHADQVPDGGLPDRLSRAEGASALERHELPLRVPAEAVKGIKLVGIELRGRDVGGEEAVPVKRGQLLVARKGARRVGAAVARVENLDHPHDKRGAPLAGERDDAVARALAAEPRIVPELDALAAEVQLLRVLPVGEGGALQDRRLHGRAHLEQHERALILELSKELYRGIAGIADDEAALHPIHPDLVPFGRDRGGDGA